MYVDRVVDAELEDRLGSNGGVVIEGAKATGKTATARQVAASEVLLDVDQDARRAIAVDPNLVLEGDTPRLIDEWQVQPEIWNYIRRAIDDRGKPGQFILTGSAVPSDDLTRHTGAGRISRLRMRPMSLYETGHSTGTISLRDLLDGVDPRSVRNELSISKIADLITAGGWPGHLSLSVEKSQRAVRDYLEEIRRVDIGRVGDKRRDPLKVGRLLRSLGRNVATYASNRQLALDSGGPEGPLDDATVSEYLEALERLMILENQPAWAPRLRSRSKLRNTPKRHFVDPSLAVAALRASPEQLVSDLNFLGFLFESLVIRDLRVYAQASDSTVLQYRDNTGLEVDAIVEGADGRWCAFEIKLGSGLADEAAESLLRFAQRVDTTKCGRAGSLSVIVGSGMGYVRDDGIGVIPIGAMGP